MKPHHGDRIIVTLVILVLLGAGALSWVVLRRPAPGIPTDTNKQTYCASASSAIDDLRAELHDKGRLDGRTRLAGAAHLAVLAARYCSGQTDLPDLSRALLYGNLEDLDRELARLERSF